MKNTADESIRVGFLIEQALGHITHAQNLRYWIDKDAGIIADWMLIPYHARDIWEKLPKLPFSLKLSLRARNLVRQHLRPRQLDCLYFHTQALSLFSLQLITTIPAIISLDASPKSFSLIASAYDSNPTTGFAERIKTDWFRRVFSHATGLVAFSDWVKQSLVRDYAVAPDRVKVIPSGIDTCRWQPLPRNWGQGRLRLLFVGADFRRKGGHVLLKAFREGLSDICELDIVTKDQSIAAGNSVRIHSNLSPNTPLLKELFAKADLFVLPTQGDATPFSILEAMACALPVITTRVGAIGELVQDRVTGYLIPHDDPQAIIDIVLSLAKDRAKLEPMGKAGRLAVEQKFNAETNYKTLIAFIKERGSRSKKGESNCSRSTA